MRIAGILLLLASLARAGDVEWHVELAEAARAAQRARKPILCVVLERGNADSDALEAALGRDPIRKELAQFVCLRLERAKQPALIARYDLKRSPSTILYSALVVPMRLIVGATTEQVYAERLADAARRHEAMFTPRKGGKLVDEDGEITFLHSGLCPRHCPTCTPTLTRSLRWLASQQERSGTWDAGKDADAVALTALAGMALLAEGRSFEMEARKAKHVLMDAVADDGSVPGARGEAGAALTAIFLAEACARDPDAELERKLKALARHLAAGEPGAAGIAALNHLRAAGVPVDEEAVARGARRLLATRREDHSFASPAALFALMRCGAVPRAELEPTWAWFRRHYREADDRELLFTALSMTARSPDAALEFHHSCRDRLLREQRADGSWNGSIFATAVGTIVLQLPFGELPLASRRARRAEAAQTANPSYLALPHPNCRAKVFVRDGRYWVDLVVSLDRPADANYLGELRAGIEGANRRLFDVTDGQFSLHRVDVHPDRGAWDRADVLITKKFYDAQANPLPWAHGVTRLLGMTVNRGPQKGTTYRFGQWIMFPPEGVWWSDPRYQHVLAHELGHYLFGAPDEYGLESGESLCPCIMGVRDHTELCTGKSHTDKWQPDACWTLAKRSYPLLTVPETPDPGPWDPPVPRIVIHR